MDLVIPADAAKPTAFELARDWLTANQLHIDTVDDQRPWGGFLVLTEASRLPFVRLCLPELVNQLQADERLSCKLMLIGPGKQSSWQYHLRRQELWNIVAGPLGMIRSVDDNLSSVEPLAVDQRVQFDPLVRHRFIGLETWGAIAEVWRYTDLTNLSDELDIVRVADDFGRN